MSRAGDWLAELGAGCSWPDVVTDAEREDLHRLWREPWWEVASAIAETGHDCTVLDPGATEDRDWSRGDAVISVRQHTGLGWTIVVSEAEAETELEDEGPQPARRAQQECG